MTLENWEAVPATAPHWTERHARELMAQREDNRVLRERLAAAEAERDVNAEQCQLHQVMEEYELGYIQGAQACGLVMQERLDAAIQERDRARGWAKRWKRYTIHFRKGLRHADRAIVGLAGDFIRAVDDERTAEQDRDALRARAERAEAALRRFTKRRGGTVIHDGKQFCEECWGEWPREVDDDDCSYCIARAYFQEPPARADSTIAAMRPVVDAARTWAVPYSYQTPAQWRAYAQKVVDEGRGNGAPYWEIAGLMEAVERYEAWETTDEARAVLEPPARAGEVMG